MIAASDAQPSDRYGWHWAIFLSLVGALGVWWWMTSHQMKPRPDMAAPAVGHSLYSIVHLPEMPSDADGARLVQSRLNEWLGAVKAAHLQPVLLSQVYDRTREGQNLPDKAIVFVFDPGYRHTIETVAPIFESHRVPAVWFTKPNDTGMVDRRFLSAHALDKVRRNGLWDVVHVKGETQAELWRPDQPIKLGGSSLLWKPGSGRYGLNDGFKRSGMNRLHANVRWTGAEFVDRILADMRLLGPAYLTVRKIQDRDWGVFSTTNDPAQARFALQAPLSKRFASASWPATRGISNMKANLDVGSVTGDLWLGLRVDDVTGDGLFIGLSNGQLLIEESVHHQRERLHTGPGPESLRGASLMVLLEGRRLLVEAGGQPPVRLETLQQDRTEDGLVRLTINGRISGLAEAKGLLLHLTPLEK